VERDKADTYALGPVHSLWGSSYFRQYDLIAIFHREAAVAKSIVGETIQLAKLEGNEVLYLAKEEAPTPVRLASDPGMKFPAHATALGKALLSGLQDETLHELYPGEALAGLTPYTLRTKEELFEQLRTVSRNGYATDVQEAVVGFCCVAAPVIDRSGKAVAAVSCSMPLHQWERKEEIAKREIIALAQRLSFH
jgi:DNA-binding IclR family transcriptional regulator